MLQNYGASKDCPFCGNKKTTLIQRKHLLLHLRKCESCLLQFRWPGDASNEHYQEPFAPEGLDNPVYGIPKTETIERLKANNFRNSDLDFSPRVALLQSLHPHGRMLDFGCSWGYGVYQMKTGGYDAFGFELSRPRAQVGRGQLALNIIDSSEVLNQLSPASLDIIFTCHVIEHITSLREIFQTFRRLIKPDGILLILVPNCGGSDARAKGVGWGPTISEEHVNAFTREFFEKNLPDFGFEVTAFSDYSNPEAVRDAISASVRLPADGDELAIVAKPREGVRHPLHSTDSSNSVPIHS